MYTCGMTQAGQGPACHQAMLPSARCCRYPVPCGWHRAALPLPLGSPILTLGACMHLFDGGSAWRQHGDVALARSEMSADKVGACAAQQDAAMAWLRCICWLGTASFVSMLQACGPGGAKFAADCGLHCADAAAWAAHWRWPRRAPGTRGRSGSRCAFSSRTA